MRRHRRRSQRLRSAVDRLPRRTREAMLRGIDTSTIIVGGYADREGGICPMLAAHRNGGRTSFAGFARAWDEFTGAGKRPRRASRRELRVLRSYLEMSLLDEISPLDQPLRPRPGDPDRSAELRGRPGWAWSRPTRSYDVFQATSAAALERQSEQAVVESLDRPKSAAAHR